MRDFNDTDDKISQKNKKVKLAAGAMTALATSSVFTGAYYLGSNSFELQGTTLNINSLTNNAHKLELMVDGVLQNTLYTSEIDSSSLDLSNLLNSKDLNHIENIELLYSEKDASALITDVEDDCIRILRVTVRDSKNNELYTEDFEYDFKSDPVYKIDDTTVDTNFSFSLDDIAPGTKVIPVIKEDQYNNKSEAFDLVVYNISSSYKDGNITIEDYTQDYTYEIRVNDTVINDSSKLKDLLIDIEAPTSPTGISKSGNTFKFNKSSDLGTKYIINLKAVGNKVNNIVLNTFEDTIISGIKGYNITLTKDNKVIKDTFTEKTSIDFGELSSGDYIFSVSAVDMSGNISLPSSEKFTVNEKVTIEVNTGSSNKVNTSYKPVNSTNKVTTQSTPNKVTEDTSKNKVVVSTKKEEVTSTTEVKKENINTGSSNSSSNNTTTNATTSTTSTTHKNDELIDSIIVIEGSVSNESRNSLKATLRKLPTNVLNKFKASGLKVVLTSKNVANYYNGSTSGNITGLFDPMARKLYINHNYIKKSTIHEFGHAVDLFYGKSNYSSFNQEWISIYNSEKESASSSYYKKNAQEYFAESFKTYLESPSSLKKSAPQTYAYISKAVQAI